MLSHTNIKGHCETLGKLQLIVNHLEAGLFKRSVGCVFVVVVTDKSINQGVYFPLKSPMTYPCNVYRILSTICAVRFEGHVTLREAIAVYCRMTVDHNFYIKDRFISRKSRQVF